MNYEELTTDLSQSNSHTLLLCPMHIGGDSTDIETFVEDVWRKPVTDKNYKQVAQEFRKWYQQVAPDEYHDPESDPFWNRDTAGRFTKGHQVNAKPEHYTQISVRLEPTHIDWLKAQPANRSAVLRELINKEMNSE